LFIGTAVEERGFLIAQEPAVGSGAMIIALAEAIMDSGFNYRQHLHVTAVDIDQRAVHMAYIQFLLLHIPEIPTGGRRYADFSDTLQLCRKALLADISRRRQKAGHSILCC